MGNACFDHPPAAIIPCRPTGRALTLQSSPKRVTPGHRRRVRKKQRRGRSQVRGGRSVFVVGASPHTRVVLAMCDSLVWTPRVEHLLPPLHAPTVLNDRLTSVSSGRISQRCVAGVPSLLLHHFVCAGGCGSTASRSTKNLGTSLADRQSFTACRACLWDHRHRHRVDYCFVPWLGLLARQRGHGPFVRSVGRGRTYVSVHHVLCCWIKK